MTTKMRKNVNNLTASGTDNVSIDNSNWRTLWADGKCPLCSGKFNGAQGVRVHVSNAHPQLSQDMKIARREEKSRHKRIKTVPVTSHQSPTIENDITITVERPPERLTPSTEPWESVFSELLARSDSEDISADFDDQVEKCGQFLFESIQQLKGPKHHNTKFYEARHSGRARRIKPGFHRSSNPMRRDKRRKEIAKEQYQYELAQYHYYNTRRRAVRTVMKPSDKKSCTIPLAEVETHFRSLLETPNNNTKDHYATPTACEENDDNVITVKEVQDAIKGMAIDTAPGPDRVLMRAVKALKCEKLISLIGTLMYKTSLVPKSFRSGRTVLISKEGDPKIPKNWRPITIFSVLRRIIERVLDRRLRERVQFCTSQRGFVNIPGTHINASIVNGIMRSAKKHKKSCVLTFLDISKAFDNVGHLHIRRTLESLPLPDNLRGLICNLCENNDSQIQVGPDLTQQIPLKRGVPQGSPLSPTIFNLCIDFILKELNEDSVAQECGYTLAEGLAPITCLAFADDLVLLAKDEATARRLVELAIRGLQTIGLEINPLKSQAVAFCNGRLCPREEGLPLLPDSSIPTLGPGEKLRYLGVDYEDEIVVDEARILRDLKNSIDLLTNTNLLHPDQKLNIVNNFIWPTLIYPLQMAPLHKLKKGFLDDVDFLVRGAVKQFCNLPMDTPNAMLYASQKHRGLGVMKASWEAFLQSLNIARKLEKSTDPHLHHCRDFSSEITTCLTELGMIDTCSALAPLSTQLASETAAAACSPATPASDCEKSETLLLPESTENSCPSARTLRQKLREKEFRSWCALPHRGKGVEVFSEVPICNKWVSVKSGLSTSEWTTALKMSSNNCNVRANPRTASSTNHCRHCGEYETLAHVLGKCPRGELLRNARHHRVCDTIADELRKRSCTVFREDHVAIADQGSRFTDLVVVDSRSGITKGFVLDPTIRFEKSLDQAENVDTEKAAIYGPTISIYRERLPEVTEWQVIGLLFGARGAIPRLTAEKLLQTLGLSKIVLRDLSINVLRDSLGILHHHLYSRD